MAQSWLWGSQIAFYKNQNREIIGKSQNWVEPRPYSLFQEQNFGKSDQNLSGPS